MIKKFLLCKFALIFLTYPTANFTAIAQSEAPSKAVRLMNLYDAFGKESKDLQQDFGFSSIIEYKGKTILFDAGTNSQIFEQNLKKLNIDLRDVDIAILSHAHPDHIGGFDYLLSVNPKVKIYLPNDIFALGAPGIFPFKDADPTIAETLSKDQQYFRGEQGVDGMAAEPTTRFWKADVEFVKEAQEVIPGLTLIPTVSQLMGTYIKYPPFESNPRFIGIPELSASFSTEEGQLIIAGCSHSTIETIIQETLKIRKEKILLVTGGFHLIPYDRDYIEGLAKRMKEEYAVEDVAPAHCTGHLGFSIFQKSFGSNYKFFGLGEEIIYNPSH